MKDSSEQAKSTESRTKENGFIRSDVAEAEGWISEPAPEPVRCKWCGKQLYFYGGYLPGMKRKEVLFWNEFPEPCDCSEAVAERDRAWREHLAETEEKKKRQAAERMRQKVAKLFQDSGLRGRFINRTFDTFELNQENRSAYISARQYAEHFEEMLPIKDDRGNIKPPKISRNGLFVTGSYGTGKTHLVSAIANYLLSQGTPVICMTMIDLLARIKQTFDRSERITEGEVMRVYEEIPLLIIDDIGSEQPTEWGASKIFAIVNARYEAYMPIIVTTNYTGGELVRRMSPTSSSGRVMDSKNAEKTVDRLKEMCVGVEMNWTSWRSR